MVVCDKCDDYYHEFCVPKVPDEVWEDKSSKYCCTTCSDRGCMVSMVQSLLSVNVRCCLLVIIALYLLLMPCICYQFPMNKMGNVTVDVQPSISNYN